MKHPTPSSCSRCGIFFHCPHRVMRANQDTVRREYGIEVTAEVPKDQFDAVILAVAHEAFRGLDVRSFLKESGIVYDVKGVLPREVIDARL